MKRFTLPLAALCLLLAGTLFGVDRYSNGAGGGLFNDVNTWSNGIPVGSDLFAILPGDVVTVPDGYGFYTGGGRPTIGGLLVVAPNGTISVDRVVTTLGVWPGGGINCSGTFSCARMGPTAPFTVNLYSGKFTISSTVAANSHSNAIFGGRFFSVTTSMTGGTLLDGGTIDGNNAALYFGSALYWTKGTIVNKNFASNTDRGAFNREFKDNCIFDINDQSHTNQRIMVDFASVPYAWTNGGVVQFDVYSSISNDCDCLHTTSLGSIVGTNVVFELGDGQGLPGTLADYQNVQYQVVLATNANGDTDYTGFNPTVPEVVTWNIGGVDRPVGLINNIPVDGTIRIVPEPAAAMAAVCLMLCAARRKLTGFSRG